MASIIEIVSSNWLGISLFFFLVGQLVSSLELYNNRELFCKNGLLDVEIVKLYFPQKLFPNKSIITILIVARIIFTLILFMLLAFNQQNEMFFYILLILSLFTDLYLNITMPVGKDGSDQMINIYLATIVFYLIFAKIPLGRVPLIFIASQLCLAYAAAGISKLASATWRKTEVLSLIFSTETYGMQQVSLFFKRNPRISLFTAWSIMLWETAFPALGFFGTGILLCSLLAGLIFHFLNYVIMGLNKFFWTFLACYPVYIHVLKLYKIIE